MVAEIRVLIPHHHCMRFNIVLNSIFLVRKNGFTSWSEIDQNKPMEKGYKAQVPTIVIRWLMKVG